MPAVPPPAADRRRRPPRPGPGGPRGERGATYDLGAAVAAGVLEAGLPLLVGPVPEAGVFNLRRTGRAIRRGQSRR